MTTKKRKMMLSNRFPFDPKLNTMIHELPKDDTNDIQWKSFNVFESILELVEIRPVGNTSFIACMKDSAGRTWFMSAFHFWSAYIKDQMSGQLPSEMVVKVENQSWSPRKIANSYYLCAANSNDKKDDKKKQRLVPFKENEMCSQVKKGDLVVWKQSSEFKGTIYLHQIEQIGATAFTAMVVNEQKIIYPMTSIEWIRVFVPNKIRLNGSWIPKRIGSKYYLVSKTVIANVPE